MDTEQEIIVERCQLPLYVITYHPLFRKAVLAELQAVDSDVQVLDDLDDDSLLVRLSSPACNLATAYRDQPPIFIQHIAIVQIMVSLDGTMDDLHRLLVGTNMANPLEQGRTFAVQCRKGKHGKVAYTSKDVEVYVGSHFEARGLKPEFIQPEQVISIYIDEEHGYIGTSHSGDNLSEQADEHRRYSRWTAHISRAEFKLREALDRFDVILNANAQALDLGAAPGGWSKVLSDAGVTVTAVDPADLSPALVSNPLIKHIPARIETLSFSPETFDLIVNDMNLDPEESAAIMCRAAPYLKPVAPAIMTIKLVVRNPLRLIPRTVSILQHAYKVMAIKHMFHNRQEVTVLLERKLTIEPGWENYLKNIQEAS